MKILNEIVKCIDKIVNLIFIILLIIALSFGGYAIYDAYCVYDSANIPSNIARFRPDENDKFSLKSLQQENEDMCGWIRLDNTNLDYAIVQGEDNSEYLHANYNKEYSVTGCIFLDYRNNRDFKDDYSIIYGHNMNSDQMFADVKKYKDKAFFDGHPTGKLYTSQGVYKINVYCYAEISAFSNKAYNLKAYGNGRNPELIDFYSSQAMHKSDIATDGKQLIMLSTCDVTDVNIRSVLVGTIDKIKASEIINEETDSKLEKEEKREVKPADPNDKNIVMQKDTKNFKLKRNHIILIILIIMIIMILVELIVLKIKKREKKNNVGKKIATLEEQIYEEINELNETKINVKSGVFKQKDKKQKIKEEKINLKDENKEKVKNKEKEGNKERIVKTEVKEERKPRSKKKKKKKKEKRKKAKHIGNGYQKKKKSVKKKIKKQKQVKKEPEIKYEGKRFKK